MLNEDKNTGNQADIWPIGYLTFSCSTQLSMKLNMLINVKMLTIVGILTFICMMNTFSEFENLLCRVVIKICTRLYTKHRFSCDTCLPKYLFSVYKGLF